MADDVSKRHSCAFETDRITLSALLFGRRRRGLLRFFGFSAAAAKNARPEPAFRARIVDARRHHDRSTGTDSSVSAGRARRAGGASGRRGSGSGRPNRRRRQLPEAILEYRKAVELRPDLSRAQLDLGAALAAQGDLAGAAERLREAAKGRDPEVAWQATRALQQLGAQ